MSAIIFAGPSLGAPPPLPAGLTLKGPAVAGDVYAAARGGARVIGLIDGAFEDRATVWHKEILFALSQGARVLGAASLGALRAVECAPFGMEGVGEIFARFARGALEDDAELALTFGPAELGYPALTTPLVNVRATLERAEAEAVCAPEAAAALLARARGLYFKELTWPRLLDEAAGLGWPGGAIARLAGWLPEGMVDLKRADALALIAAAADALEAPAPSRPALRFDETTAWRRSVEWFEREGHPLSGLEAAVLDEMRLDPVRFERALTRAYARGAARGAETAPGASGPALIEELRLRLDLPTAAAFRAWLAAVGGAPERLAEALDAEERLREALDRAAGELAPALLDEARIDGVYESLAARARAKQALTDPAPPRYDESELLDLLDALCARRRISMGVEDPDLLARSLGLSDRRALHRLLRAEEDFVAAGETERRA